MDAVRFNLSFMLMMLMSILLWLDIFESHLSEVGDMRVWDGKSCNRILNLSKICQRQECGDKNV